MRAKTSCGRRLIGVQIPAKLTEKVKSQISTGAPLHSVSIDQPSQSVIVEVELKSEQLSRHRKQKHKREAAFATPGTFSNEIETDDDEVLGTEVEASEVAIHRQATEDLIFSGLWVADEEAETLYVQAEQRRSVQTTEKQSALRSSGRHLRAKVQEGTETESDDESEEDNIPLASRTGRAASGISSTDGLSLEGKPKHAERSCQDASALMVDKVLTHEIKKLRIKSCARQWIKDIAASFLNKLLARDELAGSMSEMSVKKAIRNWIPSSKFPGGVGEKLRSRLLGLPSFHVYCCCPMLAAFSGLP